MSFYIVCTSKVGTVFGSDFILTFKAVCDYDCVMVEVGIEFRLGSGVSISSRMCVLVPLITLKESISVLKRNKEIRCRSTGNCNHGSREPPHSV